MELTTQQLEQIKGFKEKGYTLDQVKEYYAAQKLGRTSYIQEREAGRIQKAEEQNLSSLEWQKVVAAPAKFLARGAVDTFGSYLANRGIGTDVDPDTVQQYVKDPTNRQLAGAFLQTAGLAADVGITVASLGAATPMTLARNVALGGTSGYVYDFSDDLIAEKSYTDALTPGWGTFLGTAFPLAAAGAGAAYRHFRPAAGVADDIGRAVAPTAREGVESIAPAVRAGVDEGVESTTETIGRGGEEAISQLAQRIRRVGTRIGDTLEENARKSAIKEGATPEVIRAIDDGIDLRVIDRIQRADEATQDAYRAVVQVAGGADPAQAERISGNYAAEMYNITKGRERLFGEQLGEARRALGTSPIDKYVYQDTLINLKDAFKQNGILLKADGTVDFLRPKYTPEKEAVIRNVWNKLAAYQSEITPRDVDDLAKFLSDTQFKTNVTDKIGDVFIDVVDPRTGQVHARPIFAVIRDSYDGMLVQVDKTGAIAENKRLFSAAKKINENIESTWFNGIDINKASPEQLADAASIALRRLNSRAASRVKYDMYYEALDSYARQAVGDTPVYAGPNAADVSDFYITTVEKMFPESTPAASFGGPFAGIRSLVDKAFNLGKPQLSDQQKALRGLLKMGDDVTPPVSGPATESAFGAVAGFEIDEEGNFDFNPVSAGLGIAAVGAASKLNGGKINPSKVAKNLKKDDLKLIAEYLDGPDSLQAFEKIAPMAKAMGVPDNASFDAIRSFFRAVLNESNL